VSVTDVLAIIAGAFGVGTGASPLLQAHRVRRRRAADDVSLPFSVVLLCGGTAWLSYGVALGNAALIVGNGVGVAASFSAVVVARQYRDRS